MAMQICHDECLNGVTSTLEEGFDDPDVVNLAEMEPSVQIKANTDPDESEKNGNRDLLFIFILSGRYERTEDEK